MKKFLFFTSLLLTTGCAGSSSDSSEYQTAQVSDASPVPMATDIPQNSAIDTPEPSGTDTPSSDSTPENSEATDTPSSDNSSSSNCQYIFRIGGSSFTMSQQEYDEWNNEIKSNKDITEPINLDGKEVYKIILTPDEAKTIQIEKSSGCQ